MEIFRGFRVLLVIVCEQLPCILTMMVIRGFTFYPVACNVWMGGLYLLGFSLKVELGNLL